MQSDAASSSLGVGLCLFKRRNDLLVVFGGGVLLLFVHSSQPRLSPGVGAGAAKWFVCCALPTGIVPKSNTMLINLESQTVRYCRRLKNDAESLP